MKRKLFALLLAALLALGTTFCFAGCGGGNGSASTPSDPSAPSSPSSPSSPSDTDPDDKTKPETPAEPSTPEEPDEKQDETPENPEEPKENPDDTPTDPSAEKFSLAENREKILENIKPMVNFYKKRILGNTATIDELFDVYIQSDKISTIIGAVFAATANKSNFLTYASIEMPLQQNLSYQSLSYSKIQYDASSLHFNTIYSFNMSPTNYELYQSTIEKIQRKVFENYDDALWLGWSGTKSPQYDEHKLVCYDGKQIKEIWITITNDHSTLTFPSGAVDKYFVNDQYNRYDGLGTTINLPEDTLSALIEKELREAEQE